MTGSTAEVRPSDSLSTVIRPASSSSVTAAETAPDRRGQALAPQQLRLVPGVRDELDGDPPPGVREERLVAVLEQAPHPTAYGRGVGQQPPGEVHLPRSARGGQLQGAVPHRRVVQRRRRPRPVVAGAGELQRRGDEPLVVQLVQQVQLLRQRGPGPAVAAPDPGERHEHVGEGVPPEELRLQHPVREIGLQGRRGRGGPAVQPRMVPGLGERVQGQAQLGQRRGRENDLVGGESRDVYVHAHPSMVGGTSPARRPV